MTKILIALAVFLLVAGGILFIAVSIYEYFSAKLEVQSSPREPMFICDKHGPLRKNSLITFLEQEYCPICFHEKVNQVRFDGSVNLKSKDYN